MFIELRDKSNGNIIFILSLPSNLCKTKATGDSLSAQFISHNNLLFSKQRSVQNHTCSPWRFKPCTKKSTHWIISVQDLIVQFYWALSMVIEDLICCINSKCGLDFPFGGGGGGRYPQKTWPITYTFFFLQNFCGDVLIFSFLFLTWSKFDNPLKTWLLNQYLVSARPFN